MMKQQLTTTLKHSISNVLETMFFLPAQIHDQIREINGQGPTPAQWLAMIPALAGATIGFQGPLTGSAFFILAEDMLKEMCANFLGLEQAEVTAVQQSDTLKETLNMIAGHMLSLADDKGEFHLGIPDLIEPGELTDEKIRSLPDDSILIETAGGHLLAGIIIND